jgi:hypothetical protein
MPYSADEGKAWAVEALSGREVSSVLDIGAGAGAWLDVLKPRFPGARYTAVEIYEPYLDTFDLRSRYDAVIVGDARTAVLPRADLVVLGDVLEHMPVEDAVALWNRCRRLAPVVVASLPLGEYPQGPEFGNVHETHVATWTADAVLRDLPGIVRHRAGEVVGVFIAEQPRHRPRIAVATIAKDEEQFVERWAASADGADGLFIADTGSSDGTVALARSLGIHVSEIEVRPWRFDRARNAGLEAIPEDYDIVITLDMDEVLAPGWREALEAAPPAERYTYLYTWSFHSDGSPDVQFVADRCHARKGWRWRMPVHEVLEPIGGGTVPTADGGFAIEHHPDPAKSRAQYLPLLALAVEEAPWDDRMAHYYGRELLFAGRWAEAREQLVRHLALPSAVWPDERAQSYRFIARIDDNPEPWLLRACAEAPWRREPWLDLAHHYNDHGMPLQASGAVARALTITDRRPTYITEAAAWDDEALRDWMRQLVRAARR